MTGTLQPQRDPRLLVGFGNADDAGVVALDRRRALIQTVDFFTPIVDDPFTFGVIAATNALSDVYAMGGTPLCAMNIVGFPEKDLPEWVLAEILRGGAETLAEANTMLVGGHSVKDPEIKYGLAVSGLVDPGHIWKNGGARPGDALVLTKAIGTGVLTTARKRDNIEEDALADAIASMRTLNRAAAEAAAGGTVRACTDVTGNGLGGHAMEMARASGVGLHLYVDAIPLLKGAWEAAAAGNVPGGTRSNARYCGDALQFDEGVDPVWRDLVLDPQTSGGLLLAVPADEVDGLLARLDGSGVQVGTVTEGPARVQVS